MIAPRKTFARNRRQAKKETRIWEKEERRRRTEVEDKKKKKATEYFRTLLAHREEFFRFHKNKRIGKRKIKEVGLSFFLLFPSSTSQTPFFLSLSGPHTRLRHTYLFHHLPDPITLCFFFMIQCLNSLLVVAFLIIRVFKSSESCQDLD